MVAAAAEEEEEAAAVWPLLSFVRRAYLPAILPPIKRPYDLTAVQSFHRAVQTQCHPRPPIPNKYDTSLYLT